MSGHTPGPWIAREWSCHATTTVVANERGKLAGIDWPGVVAECSGSSFDTGVEEANARLIAAAPDLLAACQSAVASFKQLVNIGRIPPNFKGLRDALAAISVATGEPQGSAEGRGKENPHA